MILVPGTQGEADWIKARAGIPTASQFDRILTPAKLEPSKSSFGYLCDLVAERRLGVSLEPGEPGKWGNDWLERGKALEEAAVKQYEFLQDVECSEVGLCLRDDRSAGCSPDRLVGDEGGLEIKCPSAGQHVAYLLAKELPREYRLQVQGSLWVTGRAWWDFMSYNPSLPPFIIRVKPEPDVQAALDSVMPTFCKRLEMAVKEISE